MSYSRWADSNWYAFRESGNHTSKETEVLALFHRRENGDQMLNWTYAQLENVADRRKWLQEEYAGLTDDDVEHAIGIIGTFCVDVDLHFEAKLLEELRLNPTPENIQTATQLFFDKEGFVRKIDLFLSWPADKWQADFLNRLERMTIRDIFETKHTICFELLENVEKFVARDRVLHIIGSWQQDLVELSAQVTETKGPEQTPEEKLLRAIFGGTPPLAELVREAIDSTNDAAQKLKD